MCYWISWEDKVQNAELWRKETQSVEIHESVDFATVTKLILLTTQQNNKSRDKLLQ